MFSIFTLSIIICMAEFESSAWEFCFSVGLFYVHLLIVKSYIFSISIYLFSCIYTFFGNAL